MQTDYTADRRAWERLRLLPDNPYFRRAIYAARRAGLVPTGALFAALIASYRLPGIPGVTVDPGFLAATMLIDLLSPQRPPVWRGCATWFRLLRIDMVGHANERIRAEQQRVDEAGSYIRSWSFPMISGSIGDVSVRLVRAPEGDQLRFTGRLAELTEDELDLAFAFAKRVLRAAAGRTRLNAADIAMIDQAQPPFPERPEWKRRIQHVVDAWPKTDAPSRRARPQLRRDLLWHWLLKSRKWTAARIADDWCTRHPDACDEVDENTVRVAVHRLDDDLRPVLPWPP